MPKLTNEELRDCKENCPTAALDKRVKDAEHKGWCDALRAVQGSIEGYPNMGGDIGIMTALSRMLDEARLEKVLLLRDAYGEVGHGAFIAFVEGQISKLRAIPAAPIETREQKAARFIAESGKQVHASDCSTSIAPAEEPEPCDCDAPQPVPAAPPKEIK